MDHRQQIGHTHGCDILVVIYSGLMGGAERSMLDCAAAMHDVAEFFIHIACPAGTPVHAESHRRGHRSPPPPRGGVLHRRRRRPSSASASARRRSSLHGRSHQRPRGQDYGGASWAGKTSPNENLPNRISKRSWTTSPDRTAISSSLHMSPRTTSKNHCAR